MKPATVSENLRVLLESAQLADSALAETSNPLVEKRIAAVRNVVVFGRRVLYALHELGKRDPGFNDLYAQMRQAMTEDPLMQRFDDLAVELLRERSPQLNVTHLAIPSAGSKFGSRPANARVFFSGDRLGGSGWELVLADGEIEKYYAALPADILPEGYTTGGGGEDPQAVTPMCEEFVAHLREMVRNARQYFE